MLTTLKLLHNKLSDTAEDAFMLLANLPGRGYVLLVNAAAVAYALYTLGS